MFRPILALALIAEGVPLAVGVGGMIVCAIAGVAHDYYCRTRECRDDGEGDPPHRR